MWFISSHSYLSSLGFPSRKTVTECKSNLSEFLFNVVILWCIECNTLSFHCDYWSLMMPSGPQMWEAVKQDPLCLSAFITADEDCGYLIWKFGAHSFFSVCHVDPPEIFLPFCQRNNSSKAVLWKHSGVKGRQKGDQRSNVICCAF